MRDIIPLTLSAYSFRTALFDLVSVPESAIHRTRGISYCAVAHVHHDADKMAEYDRRISGPQERFFANQSEAENWIDRIELVKPD